MKHYIKIYAIPIVIIVIYAFFKMPVLNFAFISTISILFFFFVMAGILDVVFNFRLNMNVNVGYSFSKVAKYNFIIAGILIVYMIIAPFITTSPFLHAKAYRNLIGSVKTSEFTKDMSPVSVNDIRLVDEDMARKLGEKKLGEDPAIGSVSKLGKFCIQDINGKLYWVAPLVHRDVIKWITSLDGTKGYVRVSASNPDDVQLIQKVGNKDIRIVYQPEAYLTQNLKRHLYMHGIVNVGMSDFTIQVDNSGMPYWAISLYKHKVGYSGSDVVGTAIVDVQTGKIKTYSIKDTPKWVDRIQPSQFVNNQIKDWGTYVNGYINSVMSEKEVLVPTDGISLVYGNDNRSYWYAGITSSGSDESTVGFMLIDSRTKEAKFYKQPGATELAAMKSAEGNVQEKNYEATFPIMYNIFGKPTYVSSLKDKAGLVKRVAFISVEDYNVLGIGTNKTEALENYKNALESNGSGSSVNNGKDKTKEVNIDGTVTRISSDVQNGNTNYYLMLDSGKDLIFTGTSKTSNKLPITLVGDKVNISYRKNKLDGSVVNIDKFNNLNLNKK